jgi:AraC family transcriptional activator of pobA
MTGKTTTSHITERVMKEANALLKHTDWSIAQIAGGLGFDEPAYFTNFYKSIMAHLRQLPELKQPECSINV